MKRICENEEREHELLAKAEAGLVGQFDAAGRELVEAWLEKREEQEHEKARTHARMREHSKKMRVLTAFGEITWANICRQWRNGTKPGTRAG
ncbi:MAG: hypothetical protein LBC18_13125 [Opitutaceae bacterium]|jgi:hypothetical protein|nr:hypothetical protein [Opitutaceae bacterium]